MQCIDISTTRSRSGPGFDALLKNIHAAANRDGYFLLEGHGVPSKLVSNARHAVNNLFALPGPQKMTAQRLRGQYRGYIERTTFAEDEGSGPPVMYEGFVVGQDTPHDHPEVELSGGLYAPNRWPQGADDVRRSVSEYWDSLNGVSDELLKLFAVSLNLEDSTFTRHFEHPLSNLVLLRYSADTASADMQPRPHTDSGVFTALLLDDIAGLELQAADGTWFTAPKTGDGLLVVIGEMLRAWSGGLYRAVPHRVRAPREVSRTTLAYFASPAYQTRIAPQVGDQSDRAFTFLAGARFKQYVSEFD